MKIGGYDPRRWMVRGKRMDNSEWVEGYLLKWLDVMIIEKTDDDNYYLKHVDPDTIEPIALPVIWEPVYRDGESEPAYYKNATCPTCGRLFEDGDIGDDYCRECGQRLHWHEN